MCKQKHNNHLPEVNLHILGVQKAGTSALAHFLSQHDDICLVEGKEAHVFDQPDFKDAKDKLGFAQKRFAKKLRHYDGEKVICDATPITLFNEHYLKACYTYNPNAKFIVILRDPVDRAESHYNMMKGRGIETHNMLRAFLSEKSRLSTDSQSEFWGANSPWRYYSYLSRGLYKKQLDRLHKVIPSEQVLVLEQSELLKKHKETLNRVFEFLGLPAQTIQSEQVFKGEKQQRTLLRFLARSYARLYFFLRRDA